ncbi:MAG: hypothetical protein WCR34_04335, partial [Bacilli bacterium]
DDESKDTIDYICLYVIYGTYENKVLNSIDGVTISINENNHPDTLIDEEHFVIDFGPISFPKKRIYFYRHVPLEVRVDLINRVLYKIDPIGLAKLGCPKDEYMIEAKEIAKRINTVSGYKLRDEVFKVFKYYFDKEISKAICSKIVKEIYSKINFNMHFLDLKRSDALKNLEIINEYELKLAIHDGFVVTTKGGNTYINGKFYYDIEDQDLKGCFIDFVNDDDVVYIQLKRKTFLSVIFGFYRTNYFFEIPKKSFRLSKYIKNKNVELIFTNKEILFSR